MRSSRIGIMAASARLAALLVAEPSRYSGGVDSARPDPREDTEKISRQRKRWLQKQARKRQRKHR